MARQTYVLRDGELVPKDEAPPRGGLQIISDTTEGFVSQADGRVYTSKSRYREELKARGLRELGNDREGSPNLNYTPPSAKADIARALEKLGY